MPNTAASCGLRPQTLSGDSAPCIPAGCAAPQIPQHEPLDLLPVLRGNCAEIDRSRETPFVASRPRLTNLKLYA